MVEPVSPLVLTKLRVPAVRPRRVSRARLTDLLTPEIGVGCILVCSPAGYGKTTLLAEWAQALKDSGNAVAWYALDPGDDDLIPFKSYLVASFIQALGPIPELSQLAQLLRASPELELPRILPSVINAVATSGRNCTLILDDYHLIASATIHDTLAYLLEHRPENLRVAIGSRSDPPLPLARLRARGQLLEIHTGGLRFTKEETVQFLNEVMRLELPPQAVAVLEEQTEGWVAGLQLAALALQGTPARQAPASLASQMDPERLSAAFTGSHRYLVEYLMQEVVNHQPEEVQSFLMSTSILERMCAPLCAALAIDPGLQAAQSNRPPPAPLDPQSVLEHLEKSNLFVVPLDDEGTWYRYHHLFSDFLQGRLNKQPPGRIAALHRAACEWLAAHGFLREAAGHAFQIQDWDFAAAFVEQHSFTLIIHSDLSTVYEWCSAFPEAVIQGHPMLCTLHALSLAYNFRRQNRARVEARLQQAGALVPGPGDGQDDRGLFDLAAVVRTFQAMAPDPAADPHELLALARLMLSNYPEGDPDRFSGLLLTGYAYLALYAVQAAEQAFETARQIALREGLLFGIVESSFHLARLAHSRGQLNLAVQICRQGKADIATRLAHAESELPALGCFDIELGCVLLEQNQLHEAESSLRRGLDLMGGGMNPYYLITAYVALFRLYEVQGRPVEAMKCLDRLEAAWPDIAFCTRGLRVMHRLRVTPEDPGALAEAAVWQREFSASLGDRAILPGLGPFGAAEAYYLAGLAWARVQIALGEGRAAAASLARQLGLAVEHGLANRVIELSLLEAQARQAQGQVQLAWAALERALAAARPAGYLRSFDQGPALNRLLVEIARRGVFRDYIELILAAILTPADRDPGQKTSAARSVQTPYGESLSERELEVLRLIARGATNQEIAAQLVITVGTVKSHINRLLGKLNAHNRTEAVARARGMGLLEI